ncbi:MAG: phospho-sugar mutase [Mycoplasmatales bacterium]
MFNVEQKITELRAQKVTENTINSYQEWLEKCPPSKQENLLSLTSEEIYQAFTGNLTFGTGGVRSVLGFGSALLNVYTVGKIASGVAAYINEKNFANKLVVIGYDSRKMSREFAQITSAVMKKKGIRCQMFDDVMPTPILSYAVRELSACIGVMITASHNPSNYNGYKVYNQTGAQITLAEANEVISLINKEALDFGLELDQAVDYIDNQLVDKYLDEVSKLTLEDVEKSIKILFSAVNGTAYKVVPRLLTTCGYNVSLVSSQCVPDGSFLNAKSINPEDLAAFEIANEYLDNHDVIVITDPDADRVGIKVRHLGEYIALTGNQVGALLIDYLLSKIDVSQLPNPVIYNTIVTGELGAKIAQKHGVAVKSTLTGFKFIGEQIDLNPDLTFLFGYEESYGYLRSSIVRDKDAVQSVLLICEMINHYQVQEKTLVDRYNEIEQAFGYHIEKTISLTKAPDKIIELIEEFKQTTEIENLEVVKTVDFSVDETGLPKEKVIKKWLKDLGWIVIRPSGTEPKVKFYIAISGTNKAELINDYQKIITKLGLEN